MAYKKRSIKEIAKMAGVSPTAVSFVINGRDGIGETTRKKILSIIKETDFHPSAASQRMTLHKSFNIAFLYAAESSPFTDLFYYEVAQGLTEELTRNRYNVVFTPLEYEQTEYDLPYIIKRQDADGVICLYETPVALLNELDQLNIPYVLVDWQSEDIGRTNISLDCERSICRAVQYLIEKGHRDIAFWGSDAIPLYYLRCLTGYQKALSEAQLPIYPGWMVNNVYDIDSAVSNINKLDTMQIRPTAICCMSDMCAINSMRAAALCGLQLPEDLSFISIDDILLSQYVHPQLTTVSYKKNEIGKTAARLLLKKLAGEAVEDMIIYSDKIIERQSVLTLSTFAE